MKPLKKVLLTFVISITGLLYASSSTVHAQAKPHERQWAFDKEKVGAVPDGWRAGETNGNSKPGKWEIVGDGSAPTPPNAVALSRTENSGRTYNLLLAEKTSFRDVEIRIKVRANDGREDQGGGPIWRAKDERNYYIARWNPLEDNFRVYYVKEGIRKQIGSARVHLDAKGWHQIRIRNVGDKIIAEIDGKSLIEVTDSTFKDTGMIGLWTKADAATAFDDVEAAEIMTLDSP